jgi:hypothetical protein
VISNAVGNFVIVVAGSGAEPGSESVILNYSRFKEISEKASIFVKFNDLLPI